jgi:hypothetical protein
MRLFKKIFFLSAFAATIPAHSAQNPFDLAKEDALLNRNFTTTTVNTENDPEWIPSREYGIKPPIRLSSVLFSKEKTSAKIMPQFSHGLSKEKTLFISQHFPSMTIDEFENLIDRLLKNKDFSEIKKSINNIKVYSLSTPTIDIPYQRVMSLRHKLIEFQSMYEALALVEITETLNLT